MHRGTWVVRVVAVLALFAVSLVGIEAATRGAAGADPPAPVDTGFPTPFSGTPQYQDLAPTEATSPAELEQPLGQHDTDEIAAALGLDEADTFTPAQYLEFISGRGVGGDPASAQLVDESVRILTNTVGRPLYSQIAGHLVPSVLASYGLFVTTDGWLESPANADAPTRLVNEVIAPRGYLTTWCAANGALGALATLYRSAYTAETLYGYVAQQISGTAQLAPNTLDGAHTLVGMSMAPALWLVNFALIYTLNPTLAADMPAYWAPVPPAVAGAILASKNGRVPYAAVASLLP